MNLNTTEWKMMRTCAAIVLINVSSEWWCDVLVYMRKRSVLHITHCVHPIISMSHITHAHIQLELMLVIQFARPKDVSVEQMCYAEPRHGPAWEMGFTHCTTTMPALYFHWQSCIRIRPYVGVWHDVVRFLPVYWCGFGSRDTNFTLACICVNDEWH